MKELLIVTLAMFICALPLAMISRRFWRWLRQANLVAELEEETIRLSDLASGLRGALAVAKGDCFEGGCTALKENENLGNQIVTLEDRITELESASRTDHQTIGDLHQQLAHMKRQVAAEKSKVTKLRKLAGVAAPKKRGAK